MWCKCRGYLSTLLSFLFLVLSFGIIAITCNVLSFVILILLFRLLLFLATINNAITAQIATDINTITIITYDVISNVLLFISLI